MSLSVRLVLPLLILALTGIGASLFIGIAAIREYGATRTAITAVDASHHMADRIEAHILGAEAAITRLLDMTALYDVGAAWSDLRTGFDQIAEHLDRYADLPLSPETTQRLDDLRNRLAQFRSQAEVLFGVRRGSVPMRDVVEAGIDRITLLSRDLSHRASADTMAAVAAAQSRFNQGVALSLGVTLLVFGVLINRSLAATRQACRGVGAITARLVAMTPAGSAGGRASGAGTQPATAGWRRGLLRLGERIGLWQHAERNELEVLNDAAAAFELRARSLEAFQTHLRLSVERGLDGHLSHVIPEPEDPDLRAIAAQMNALLRGVSVALEDVIQVMSGLSQGDLDVRMSGSYRGAYRDLAERTNATVVALSEIVTRITASTGAINRSMRSIIDGSRELAERTDRHSRQIHTLTAATATMSARAVSARTEVEGVRDVSATTRSRVIKGDLASQETTQAMAEIERITHEINKITGLIDEIAFQTSILAVNASIEAARAGDAGRGFGIVAREVRALAERAGNAASQIDALLKNAVAEVETGSQKVRSLRGMLADIRTDVEALDSSVRGIAEASAEQAQGLGALSSEIAEFNADMQQNTKMAQQSSAAAEDASAVAGDLEHLTGRFRGYEPAEFDAPAVRAVA